MPFAHRSSRPRDAAPGASTVLALAAAGEALTGAALIVAPSMVSRLLLDQPLSDASLALARFAGIPLTALAVACWPGWRQPRRAAAIAMILYSTGAAAFLGWLGAATTLCGPLLWPAVALHVLLSLALVGGWLRRSGPPTTEAATAEFAEIGAHGVAAREGEHGEATPRPPISTAADPP